MTIMLAYILITDHIVIIDYFGSDNKPPWSGLIKNCIVFVALHIY